MFNDMETIIKKIKRNGRNKITIELPVDFKADNIEVIIKSDSDEIHPLVEKEKDNEKFRSELRVFYSKFNVDLRKYKFNRDELYDR